MEINKITFENLRNLNIAQTFEDLDVNNDGVINEKDLNVSTDTTTYTAINKLLNSVDDETELLDIAKNSTKTSATNTTGTPNKNGLIETTAKDFKEALKNTKGTVYLVMGNPGNCSWCSKLDKEIKKNKDELNSMATMYTISWPENNNYCWSIYNKSGDDPSLAKYPTVAKFVDGKFVELVGKPRDPEKTVKAMKNKAGTTNTANSTNSSQKTNKYGITEINEKDFKEELPNTTGTVYLIMGSLTGCSICRNLQENIKKNKDSFNNATLYSLNWDENEKYAWKLYKEKFPDAKSAPIPVVVKFVNGKLVDVYTRPSVKKLVSNIEGTKGTNSTTSTNTTSTTSTTSSTSSTTTTSTTKTLTEEEKAKLAALKEELKTLNADIEKLNADIQALVAKNKELEEEKAKLEEEQKEAQEVADRKNEELAAEQKKLDEYSKEYENYQNELNELNSEILTEQGKAENEYNETMTNLVNKAVSEYNPAEHGEDFNAYFAKKMEDEGYPTFSILDDLNFEAKGVSSAASDVLFNIRSQSSVVASAKSAADIANSTLTSVTSNLNNVITEINSNNTQIESLQGTLKTKQTRKTEAQKEINELDPVEGAGLSGTEVLAKISDAEKKLAIDNNIDITTCMVAMGQDGKFHIYEQDGTSLARKYGTGSGLKGADVVPSGSGYMRNIKDAAEGQGRAVYTFSCVNECLTEGEADYKSCCYCTCSPLSFDINGDGVQTTENTISYDIDGDGKLDVINDSADWVLAFDKDKDGIAGKDGSELFGNNTDLDGDGVKDGYKDGFEALKALAKKEGLIGENDTKLDEADIKLLSEKYGLTMKNGYQGETKGLSDLGITEINLAQTDKTNLKTNFDNRHNNIMTQEGATFVVNGQTRDYADIWNAKKDASELTLPTDKLDLVRANIDETHVNLHLNKDGVVALKGDIDAQSIKNNAMNKAEAPTNIFEEIIEIEEDEEI